MPQDMSDSEMNILDLPNVVLLEILEYLPFDEVSKKRLVCRRFDQLCQQVLNSGFNKVIKQHAMTLKRIKALLPRRESERRNHCLARHADILSSIETRISMLSMTYTKYIDLNLCCFIPGRVLDEIFRILRLTVKSTKPLRPHVVLQELRDISSMAMEHFDDKIANTLKKTFTDRSNSSSSNANSSLWRDCKRIASSRSLWRDNRRLASTSGIDNISLSGMEAATSESLLSSPTSFSDSGGYMDNPDLDLLGERLTKKYCAFPLAFDDNASSTSAACYGDQHLASSAHGENDCPSMAYCRKLEEEHKKDVAKINRLQMEHFVHHKRLQEALSTLAELNGQVVDLKKRLEDVDAKNREMSANIRHINGGSSPNESEAAPLCNSLPDANGAQLGSSSPTQSNANDSSSSVEVIPSPDSEPCCSSPSLETAEKQVSKRHIDHVVIEMATDESKSPSKKPKLDL